MSNTADQTLVRKLNKAIVLSAIRRQAPLSRAELAGSTGLNRSTVSSIVSELLQEALVQETTLQADRVGRPGMELVLNPAGGFAVGIELGVDFISLVVTDFVATPLWRRREASNPADGQAAILERAYALTRQALQEGAARGLRPLGIGLGVPGLVDLRHGELKMAPNLGWKDTPLRQLWAERFGLPVFVENEANAAALGEYYFGAGRGVDHLVYLSAGVGLGAGILMDGRLFRGSQGYAAEVGHIIVDPGGELCGCGRRGCWETLVGPRAVLRRLHTTLSQGVPGPVLLRAAGGDLERVTFEMVAAAALEGDPAALQSMQEVAASLGAGIASLVNIFNPRMVVLGGQLNFASPILLPVIRQVVRDSALDLPARGVTFAASAHGPDACVMGAAALVLDDILAEPLNFDKQKW